MSIGGYLGLELNKKQNNLLDGKLLFNSGRSACVYYLQEYGVSKVWVPYYICGDFVQTLQESGVDVEYYTIDLDFKINQEIPKDEHILYVNYFGVMDSYIIDLFKIHTNLIVDNSQALFNNPVYNNIPTFYSPRKFLGVPDGGMLSINKINQKELYSIKSFDSAAHLLKQIDVDTEEGYLDFVLNEKKLIKEDVQKISNLSKRIIESIDTDSILYQRIKNFCYLETHLKTKNNLTLPNVSAFSYPLLAEDGEKLREYLREKKIFTPTLWSDQLGIVENESIEYNLITNIVHLPIDQRYNETEMDIILKTIEEYYD